MSRHLPDGYELRQDMPASLLAIEEFCVGFRCWAELVALPDRFGVELLAREALTNAALHGCSADSSKQLTCVLRLRAGRVVIAVRDQGEGFDWHAAWKCRPAPGACSGRGLPILYQFAHKVRFNHRGNSVTMIKRLDGEGI